MVSKSVSALIDLYHESEAYLDARIFHVDSRSKSRAKERDAANVQKPLQINGPKVRSLTQGRKESDFGPTGSTSGGQSGTKQGKVNIKGLYDLIHGDDRRFHYHNVFPPS